MAKSYMWTLIIRNIDNEYVKTNHYYTKANALEDLKYYTSIAYIVTMLNHGIYLTSNNTRLES